MKKTSTNYLRNFRFFRILSEIPTDIFFNVPRIPSEIPLVNPLENQKKNAKRSFRIFCENSLRNYFKFTF